MRGKWVMSHGQALIVQGVIVGLAGAVLGLRGRPAFGGPRVTS